MLDLPMQPGAQLHVRRDERGDDGGSDNACAGDNRTFPY
jgi:hypothetical protein